MNTINNAEYILRMGKWSQSNLEITTILIYLHPKLVEDMHKHFYQLLLL